MSMSVMEQDVCSVPVQDDRKPWPAEAREMMSSLNDAFPPLMERRRVPRRRYHVEATLSLSRMDEEGSAIELYTRDVNPWSLGFITPHPLPAYEHAVLRLPTADGRTIRAKCLIRRCRSFAPGWHQGVIDFECELPEFAA